MEGIGPLGVSGREHGDTAVGGEDGAADGDGVDDGPRVRGDALHLCGLAVSEAEERADLGLTRRRERAVEVYHVVGREVKAGLTRVMQLDQGASPK